MRWTPARPPDATANSGNDENEKPATMTHESLTGKREARSILKFTAQPAWTDVIPIVQHTALNSTRSFATALFSRLDCHSFYKDASRVHIEQAARKRGFVTMRR